MAAVSFAFTASLKAWWAVLELSRSAVAAVVAAVKIVVACCCCDAVRLSWLVRKVTRRATISAGVGGVRPWASIDDVARAQFSRKTVSVFFMLMDRLLLIETRRPSLHCKEFVKLAASLLAAGLSCAAQDRILWTDPGEIERINFAHAAGGSARPPAPPFNFVSEQSGGSSPKILIQDSARIQWRVKGGYEVHSESFSTRLVAALGYAAESTWYVPGGKIENARSLKRAAGFIHPDGSFTNASFERRDPNLKSLSQDWAWNRNPFLGTKQLNGLKVLMMLLSNWDNKDVRDRRAGSNTGIAERWVNRRIQLIYRVTDWGQTLGAWGPEPKPKGWNCQAFTAQTKSFVQGRQGEYVRFGYSGHYTDDFKNDIKVDDVRWLLLYLGRITDTQIQAGLTASGATTEEVACFSGQLRARINQLKAQTQ